ncbi:uncharacterized protein TNCV_3433981 [Trichonephila clavipes]|nr:uncharacterized protein TNCV_3433981 [Trichonephila clavipes]
MADLLTKRDMNFLQRSTRDLLLHSARLEINRIYKKCFQDAAASAVKNKSWRMLIKPNRVSDSPHATAVAEFRLLTGHDCLCAHLFRFNLTDSPFCVLWATGQVMGTSHLEVCSALKSLDCIVKKYWRAPLMAWHLVNNKIARRYYSE